MGRRAKSLTIVYPEGQKYSCRDCPARCCTSWAVPVTREEQERILTDEDALFRLGGRGLGILRTGVLPMRERDEQLACVFLDDDFLCSLHKKHGHEFLPAQCKSFPIGFSTNEKQQPVALLSRYCPSIRDNYGEPLADVIELKLEQAGGAAPLAEKMGLRSGRVLSRAHYVSVIQKWREFIQEGGDVPQSLARIYDFTDAVDEGLPANKKPSDQDLAALIEQAALVVPAPLTQGKLRFGPRVLVAHLLGGLCYPSRVMMPHRMKRISWEERLGSWWNRLAWLFSIGSVRLLFVKGPVKLRGMREVQPALPSDESRLVSGYLVELLDRRQGFSKQTYLSRVVVDMALMVVVIARYARAAAAAENLSRVGEQHLKEGIGIAELLFTHQGETGQSTVLNQLRLVLMSNRDDFRRLLSAEI